MYKFVFSPGFNTSVFTMANSGFSYHLVFLQKLQKSSDQTLRKANL